MAAGKIDHLLFVAGASGVGKSTFIDRLQAGTLTPDIRARLPAEADGWIVRKRSKWRLWLPEIMEMAARQPIPGVIIDHDTTAQVRVSGRLCDDPTFRLVRMAGVVTVVTLRAPTQRIVAQLIRRKIPGHSYQELADKWLLWAVIRFAERWPWRRLYKKIRRRWPEVSWSTVKRQERLWRKLRFYRRPGWIDDINTQWNAQVGAWTSDRIAVEHIVMQPGTGLQECFHWQVVETCVNRPRKEMGTRPGILACEQLGTGAGHELRAAAGGSIRRHDRTAWPCRATSCAHHSVPMAMIA